MGQVNCPVLLLQGTLDVVALWQPPRFLFLLPDARLRIIAGAGHNLVTDAPQVVTARSCSSWRRSIRAAQRGRGLTGWSQQSERATRRRTRTDRPACLGALAR